MIKTNTIMSIMEVGGVTRERPSAAHCSATPPATTSARMHAL